MTAFYKVWIVTGALQEMAGYKLFSTNHIQDMMNRNEGRTRAKEWNKMLYESKYV